MKTNVKISILFLLVLLLSLGCSLGTDEKVNIKGSVTNKEVSNCEFCDQHSSTSRCYLFEIWEKGKWYAKGTFVRSADDYSAVYKCKVAHRRATRDPKTDTYRWEKMTYAYVTTSVNDSSQGTITSDKNKGPGKHSIPFGNCTSFTIVPKSGYRIRYIKVDGELVVGTNVEGVSMWWDGWVDNPTLHFLGLRKDRKVEVTFIKKKNFKKAVLTCYWTFDKTLEPTKEDYDKKPILVAKNDTSINWNNSTIASIKVGLNSTTNKELWFPSSGVSDGSKQSLWERYQMEGCGFVRSSSGNAECIIQLSGKHFKYTGNTVSFKEPGTSNTVTIKKNDIITIFDVYKAGYNGSGTSNWGKAWDAVAEKESELIPWKSAAVTRNVKSQQDIYFPIMDGYEYYNPTINSKGNPETHDGKFKAHDSSWSFTKNEIDKNKGVIDAWIDIFVARYDLYEDVNDNFLYNAASNKHPNISIKKIKKYVDNNWQDQELYVADVDCEIIPWKE